MSIFKKNGGAPIAGRTHSEGTRAKISEAIPGRTGENNPMYGKTGALNPMYGKTHSPETLALMSGANNPIFGKVPTHAITVNVYSIDNLLVRSFTSQVAAANWLKIPRSTFQGYLSSGKVVGEKQSIYLPKIYY